MLDFEHPLGSAFLPVQELLPPAQHWETASTLAARRSIELLDQVGLLKDIGRELVPVPVDSTVLARCHTAEVIAAAELPATKRHAALLSASMSIAACRAVLSGDIPCAYVLTRPAGHHAKRAVSRAGCVYNNAALAASEALESGFDRVVILDWDVHHGNGTQDIFWDDPRVLTISIHQEVPSLAYTNGIQSIGGNDARGGNLNVPLPPGSGSQAYYLALDDIFAGACARFEPQLVIVACGYDASTLDPAGRMMLHSRAYGELARRVMDVAHRFSDDRLILTHEGGYAIEYVPFCVAAVVSMLSGRPDLLPTDPFLEFWEPFSGDTLTEWQASAVARARTNVDTVPLPSVS